MSYSARITHYEKLANVLREQIASGSLPVGAKLPSEAELITSSGLSRSTVRRSLSILENEGLISKERGKGAFVTARPPDDNDRFLFRSYTSSVASQGGTASTRTVDAGMAKVAGEVSKFLKTSPKASLVKLMRLRYLDGDPLCLETVYLPPEFSDIIDEDLEGSLYETLRSKYHRIPAKGHKTFEVCFATQNESFLLDVARGTALILITDYVYDTQGKPLHVSKRVMRTDRAKYMEPIGESGSAALTNR